MKFTKFAQSCVLIETKGKRILIDPGFIDFKEEYLDNEWKDIDVLLVTHKHKDHIHIPAILEILKNNPKVKFYSSKEVCDTYPEIKVNIVKVGDVVHTDDLQIEVVNAVHGYLPHLRGDNEINENIGFIIDDGDCRAYHTSDSISFKNDYKCDVLFVPVCNHGLVMGAYDAKEFAKGVGAKLVIPMHYDNIKFPADLELVESEFSELNYKFLKIGENIEY